jgi:hypothetical protein
MDRTCGTCTKCCEGYLYGEVRGLKFYPGMPCHFKGDGCCTIYPDRPKKQCQDFNCLWLTDDRLPSWMKPDKSDVILVKVQTDRHEFVEAYEAGSKIDSTILNRLLQYAMHHNLNLLYQVGGGWNAIGTPEFLADHGTIYHAIPENSEDVNATVNAGTETVTP